MGEVETIGQMLVRKPRGCGETLGTTASRTDDNINAMLQEKRVSGFEIDANTTEFSAGVL